MTDSTRDIHENGSGDGSVRDFGQDNCEILVPEPHDLRVDLDEIWADRVIACFQHGKKIVAILIEVVERTDNFISVLRALDYMHDKDWSGLIFLQGEMLEGAIYPDRIVFRSGDTQIHSLEIGIGSMEQLRGASSAASIDDLNTALAEFLVKNHQAVHCFPASRQELEDNIRRFHLNTA